MKNSFYFILKGTFVLKIAGVKCKVHKQLLTLMVYVWSWGTMLQLHNRWNLYKWMCNPNIIIICSYQQLTFLILNKVLNVTQEVINVHSIYQSSLFNVHSIYQSSLLHIIQLNLLLFNVQLIYLSITVTQRLTSHLIYNLFFLKFLFHKQ